MISCAVVLISLTLSQTTHAEYVEDVRRRNDAIALERERQFENQRWLVLEQERERRAREEEDLRRAQERDDGTQR